MSDDLKRLFLACQVEAPWPANSLGARLVQKGQRHITLAFLGEISFSKLQAALSTFPVPPYSIGIVGKFDRILFLPERSPHVVAWHVAYLEDPSPLPIFQRDVVNWLQKNGFTPRNSDREFLPHVTICRSPFKIEEWKKAFAVLPLVIKDVHLYESKGGVIYEPLWTLPMLAPFEEIDHTADIAFRLLGESIEQLHRHAQMALAFKFPSLLEYFSQKGVNSFEDLIIDLNRVLSKADSEIGIPFKAISYHGQIKQIEKNILEWEMIVDV